jgi:hypothetical protein
MITQGSRDALIEALENHLDTRDKRFMFLKCLFRNVVPISTIKLEGSAREAAWSIFEAFEKQNMLGSLMACINSVFDTDLLLIEKTPKGEKEKDF